MRLRVSRSGGLAGVTLAADLDTDELEAEAAARVERSLARLLEAPPPAAPPPHPDAFAYRIVLGDGRSATLHEHEVPDDLRPLLAEANRRGEVERRGDAAGPGR